MGRISVRRMKQERWFTMTYQELVKKVQTALVKADASKIEDHIAVQVNVTGEAEGAFYMEIADRVLYVEPYDYNDRDTLLTADGAVVLAIAQSKTTLDAAVAEGKAFAYLAAAQGSFLCWERYGAWNLVCYSPWGRKESDTTEQVNWTELISK